MIPVVLCHDFLLSYRASSDTRQKAPSHRCASYFKNRTDCAVGSKTRFFLNSASKFFAVTVVFQLSQLLLLLVYSRKELLLASVKVRVLASTTC